MCSGVCFQHQVLGSLSRTWCFALITFHFLSPPPDFFNCGKIHRSHHLFTGTALWTEHPLSGAASATLTCRTCSMVSPWRRCLHSPTAFSRLGMPKEGSPPPCPPYHFCCCSEMFIFDFCSQFEHENIYIRVWQRGGTRRLKFFVLNMFSST